jgi:hypothetical protein
LRTVRREIRNSRTIWRIGFLSTQNVRLIRPIVSTVAIPGHAPLSNQREHSMIRGVGPYSTLITLIAGSLFHPEFHAAGPGDRDALMDVLPSGLSVTASTVAQHDGVLLGVDCRSSRRARRSASISSLIVVPAAAFLRGANTSRRANYSFHRCGVRHPYQSG